MFGRKSRREQKKEKKEQFTQAKNEGLLFWLPGGSSRLDVYLDYCVMHCLGKTRLEEKSRVIPFTSIEKLVYTPATGMRHACLQLFTKEMPEVKRSYWYAYENNLVVVHPSTEELAQKIIAYIRDPYGSNIVPPDYMNQLKKERKQALRKQAEEERAPKSPDETES